MGGDDGAQGLEAVSNGSTQALAQSGVFGTKVAGVAGGNDLEMTEHYESCGHVTPNMLIEGKQSRVHEIAVTVHGGTVLLLIDAARKIRLTVKVGQIHEHEALWTCISVTQARLNLTGAARLHNVVFDQGFWGGSALRWLDQRCGACQNRLALTVDAQIDAGA
jgi:hypothetical protein